ncbi:hypothetical protein NEMBOFW57_001487 [Staphylotrichum longicolle]|uniref:Uncharacterized protein n=1 Tax=Staphylotrichum longicolle TaxID=669026 RepID=A0AAD4I3T9_9PEZI|nr:hypothetical protein NEMBOFW57_001487 [Staphylotrichum longicolle]
MGEHEVGTTPPSIPTGSAFGRVQGRNVIAGQSISGGTVNFNFHAGKDPSTRRPAYRLFPFPRNEDVVSRVTLFAELDQLLPRSGASQSAALWGLGGSGYAYYARLRRSLADNFRKTQIALEYAYRRADEEPACSVFWVHAEDETTFVSDYKNIAKNLKIPTNLDGDELLTAVRDGIEALGPYVLVLDNADNLTVFGVGRDRAAGDENTAGGMARNLFGFVPRHSGTVLWTSRDKRICGSLVGAKRAINVTRMTESEAMALLETVGNKKIDESELDNAAQLLAELERLPLAVSQAAAYMRRTSTPIGEYLSRLRRPIKRWKVLGEAEFDRHRRQQTSNNVMQTWDISIEHIQYENPMACDILYSLAFVDNQNIPFELIAKIAEIVGRLARNEEAANAEPADSRDQDENQDDDDILGAIVLLQDFSFLHLRTSGERYQAYDMHKLVQEATHSSGYYKSIS